MFRRRWSLSRRTSVTRLSQLVLRRAAVHNRNTAEPHARRIVAIGDLHGDLNKTLSVLRWRRLIDANENWSGGDTVLVQLGDMCDRGPYSLEIMQLLHKLRKQAKAQGGHVEILLGNHEVLWLQGEWSQLHPNDRLRDPVLYQQAWKDIWDSLHGGNGEAGSTAISSGQALESSEFSIGRFLMSCNAVYKRNGLLFVHGGLGPDWATLGVDTINERFREALLNREDNVLNAETSPIWHRDHTDGGRRQCAELSRVLRMLRCSHMIVGHTNPDSSGVPSTQCNGKLIMMDVWMSDWMLGDNTKSDNMAALEIENGTLQPLYLAKQR